MSRNRRQIQDWAFGVRRSSSHLPDVKTFHSATLGIGSGTCFWLSLCVSHVSSPTPCLLQQPSRFTSRQRVRVTREAARKLVCTNRIEASCHSLRVNVRVRIDTVRWEQWHGRLHEVELMHTLSQQQTRIRTGPRRQLWWSHGGPSGNLTTSD